MGHTKHRSSEPFKGFGAPSQKQQALDGYRHVMAATKERVEVQILVSEAIEAVSDFETVDTGQMVNADFTPACDYRDLVMENKAGKEIQFRIFDSYIEWDGELPPPIHKAVAHWAKEPLP